MALARSSFILRGIVASLEFVGECVLLVRDSVRSLFYGHFELNELIAQISAIGASSVPIVALTTFFSGAVMGLYSTQLLVRYGAGALAGGAIGLGVTREVAPVLAGIMIAARSGSSMAAQIGTMTVTEQVDALRALSVPPVQYLVVPRLLACMIALPMLCLIGVYSGIVGGLLVSLAGGVASGSFFDSMKRLVQPWDFQAAMIKALVFGLIVGLVACRQGLNTKEGAVGVGKATTSSVVISMVLVYIANYFLSATLYSH